MKTTPLEYYKPEPFPSPFPDAFDPREHLYEVVGVEPGGSIKVSSSRGQFLTVGPGNVAMAGLPAVGDRLFGQPEQSSVRLTALGPHPLELQYVEGWLRSLEQAGLQVDGFNAASMLEKRLRDAPLGSRRAPPLRRALRSLLEEWVGRFPQRDDSWQAEDVPALARALLGTLGVALFEASVPKRLKHPWAALEPVAEAANQALQDAGSPLRLIACERETFAESAVDGDRDYMADRPVWLVFTPSCAAALEQANVLRRYRGVQISPTVVQRDPRVLRAGSAPEPDGARVIRLDGKTSPPGSAAAVPIVPTPAPPSTEPPKTPCRATIRTFVAMDGVGELVTDGGVAVRFGVSACKDFRPTVGMDVWLMEYGPNPYGKGFKASVVNLTGASEKNRLAEAEEANRIKADRAAREAALLRKFRLKEQDWFYWKQLAAFSAERRGALATALLELKRESHLFERLFEELVTISPDLFHEQLDQLDWRSEPESLAWTGAPFGATKFAVELLSKGAAVQLRERIPVGTIAPAHDLNRRMRAPANDVGAAVLLLARCGSPEAVAVLERWAASSGTSPQELNAILAVAGWQLHDGRLHRLWGDRTARHVRKQRGGTAVLFSRSSTKCPACQDPLFALLKGAPEQGVPFALLTCPNCAVADFDPFIVQVGNGSAPRPLFADELDEEFEPTFRRDALPEELSVSFEDAPMAVPDNIEEFEQLTRIGGAPSWVQGPQTAGSCPRCSVPMRFLAQFPDPPGDTWGGDSGMFYVFGCERCRVVASFVQNH